MVLQSLTALEVEMGASHIGTMNWPSASDLLTAAEENLHQITWASISWIRKGKARVPKVEKKKSGQEDLKIIIRTQIAAETQKLFPESSKKGCFIQESTITMPLWPHLF